MNVRLLPPEGWLEARVSLPPSKSISARALVINALAGSPAPAAEAGQCDDIRVLSEALSAGEGEINVGASGTALRFLTAYFASQPGREVTIDGDARLRERPVSVLVDALRKMGTDIEYKGAEGHAPMLIRGKKLHGGELEVDATVSSQFISALMMVAPLAEGGLKLSLRGEIVSLPYILMTLEMMRQAGIEADFYGGDTVTVAEGAYTPTAFAEEGDWSAAAPWYAIEALSSGEVVLENVTPRSLQGDSAIAGIFNRMGVTTDFEPEETDGTLLSVHPDADARLTLDCSPTPDLVPSIVVTCCMLGLPFHLTGLATLATKECDRISALCEETQKLGVTLSRTAPGELSWETGRRPLFEIPRFSSHGDHRMVMALAPVSIFLPGIVIEDAEVVSKSYPGFWDDLKNAGFTLLDGDEPMPEPAEGEAE